jgi:hypothetical protein
LSDESIEELFEGLSSRVELETNFATISEKDGYFSGFQIVLDLEISKDTLLPPIHFYPNEDASIVNVKCYFCKKERTFPMGYYINSTWSPAEFKNDERGVMVCSPYCPTLLPDEQRHLFAYDNIRYKSIYTSKNTFTGEYNFSETPPHEVDFNQDGTVWNKCYFCKKRRSYSFPRGFLSFLGKFGFPHRRDSKSMLAKLYTS